MRILFIVPYPTEGPSNRFRVEQYLPTLRQNGISYDIRPFCTRDFYRILLRKGYYVRKTLYLIGFTLSRIADVIRSTKYEMIFLHREAFPTKDYVFEWLLRRVAKRLVYDFDDSIFLTKPAKVKMAVSSADLIIAGNSFLQDYASRFNGNVTAIPTCIDTEIYKPRRKNAEDKIVVGWIGTPSTAQYLLQLADVFDHLTGKYRNIEIRIIGADPALGSAIGTPLKIKEWSLAREVEELQGFDIGIMPLPDNDWAKGKCAFKIIQYMAVGIPVVASRLGMNEEVVQDGVNGMLASTSEEWCQKISSLIESPDLRRALGDKGRNTVEERYSLKVNAPKFVKTIGDCVKRGIA